MNVLFHITRCLVQMPEEADDRVVEIQIPGGMGQSETLKWWADIEDEYGAVTVEPVDRREHNLLWRT